MLLEYQRFRQATAFFREKGEEGADMLTRPPETLENAPREVHGDMMELVRAANRLLRRIADRLQLCSRPMYAEAVRRVTETRKNASLSPAALEVLTIIAYRQPVTRAFIDQLRGVDSGGTLSSLAEKQMIEEAGRLEVPGRPILYRTTEHFLQAFALESLDDLPALPAFTDNEQLSFDMEDEPPDPAPLLRTGKE